MSKFNSLRAVTHRLNNTPVKELPHIAPYLASSILSCADAFKSVSERLAGKNDELALQIHKLKSRLASLLQERSVEGRFTAIVLVKATVEAGGREILESCGPWLRGLLAILSKSDPLSSKRLCLLTITRIFSLTQQYPTLIREVTTPLLPAFVTACMRLGVLHSDDTQPTRPSPYLETVLQCILQLIPHHPNTFRPFVSKLQTALAGFIGGNSPSDQITHLAQSVFVTLHFCAPKNIAGEAWLNAYQAGITSMHGVADQIFRAVVEDWETSNSSRKQDSRRKTFDEIPRSLEDDPLSLPRWEGIYQGSRMMVSLLHLLETFLLRPTAQSTTLPIGLILDLTSRLLHIRVPENWKENQTSIRFNPEIGREEREELLAILPGIHQSTLNLLWALVEVTGVNILPASHTIVDQCLWVFTAEYSNKDVRLASYKLFNKLMPLMGPSLTRDGFKQLSGLIDVCTKDISRSFQNEMIDQSKPGSNSKAAVNGHADSFLQVPANNTATMKAPTSALETAALGLLCRVLEHVPAQAISHSLRAQIDRTAILMDQRRVLLASVLNPPPKMAGKYAVPSVMPFLARTSQDELEIEGLLRPRMPVIRQAEISTYDREADSNEDFEIPLSNHYSDFATNQQFVHSLSQPAINGSGTQNDILDRLEDSIEHRAVSPSKVETPQITTANQAIVAPLSQKNGDDSLDHSFNQPSKRASEAVDVGQEVESRKRFRGSESDRDPDLEPRLQPKSDHSMVEQTVNTSTLKNVVVDLESVITEGTEMSATNIDKGKGRAVVESPRLEQISVSTSGNADVGDDDDSDSDMPPLYLKTTDSEAEEDDDDGEIM